MGRLAHTHCWAPAHAHHHSWCVVIVACHVTSSASQRIALLVPHAPWLYPERPDVPDVTASFTTVAAARPPV